MRMVSYNNSENNPLTLGLLCCYLHVPVPSFLFRDIWPLISLREKEESVSVTNSINHFPLSLPFMYPCREPRQSFELGGAGFAQPRVQPFCPSV